MKVCVDPMKMCVCLCVCVIVGVEKTGFIFFVKMRGVVAKPFGKQVY